LLGIDEIGETAHRADRRSARRWSTAALIAVVALLVLASSASAFSQRGYRYNEALSFGSAGSGAGQMLEPAGVAVNQVTGEIYVMDAGNNRVDEFTSSHEFVRAWGAGVKAGSASKEFQICTKETGCQKGTAGHSKGQLHGAGSIAVDSDPTSPSFGDVYVEIKHYEETIGTKEKEVEFEFGLIQKYSATGAVVGKIKGWREPKKREPGEPAEERFEEELNAIAVGEKGELVAYNEEDLIIFNNEVTNKFVRKLEPENLEGEPAGALAVAANNVFYMGHFEARTTPPGKLVSKYVLEPELNEEGVPETEEDGKVIEILVPLNEAVLAEPTTGVAVSPAKNDAFVTASNSVSIFNEHDELVQKLGAGSEEDAVQQATQAVANDQSHEVLATDAGRDRVTVFSLEPEGPPKIEEAGVAKTAATSTQFTATIAPGGASSEYSFRYSTGEVPPASQPCSSPCVEVPAPAAQLPEGAEGNFANVVAPEIPVAGLTPATTYKYTAIARNAHGTVETAQQTFKTQHPVLGEGLADGRHWEMVSPPTGKNGALIYPPRFEGGLIQAAADGHAITYVASTAFEGAEGNPAPEPAQILSNRSDDGEASSWSTTDINTGAEAAAGVEAGAAPEYWLFSSDLSEALLFPKNGKALSSEAIPGEKTPYVRHNELCASEPASCYTPILTASDVTAEEEFGGGKRRFHFGLEHKWFRPLDVTANHKVVFTSEPSLTTTKGPAGNVYEWDGSKLTLVNATSEGATIGESRLGYASAVIRNAVSPDGNLVIFSTDQEGKIPHLYQRDLATGKTLQIDAPEAGLPTPKGGIGLQFQSASEDGSTIFFTDDARLTSDSTAKEGFEIHPAVPDLYVCEVEEVGGERKCKLTDLTVAGNPGEPANVQGAIPGNASDGHNVFFVANAVLAGGATKGSCRIGLQTTLDENEILAPNVCNLYTRHRTGVGTWSPTKLVATLSAEDEPDWSLGGGKENLAKMTSRVSPNGEWLTFMSDRRLPTATNPAGYNNRDAKSNRPDEEVFLYNSSTEKLLCASCDPTGARPIGVHDIRNSGEGVGLAVDGPQNWFGQYLAANIPGWTALSSDNAYYQPRYLLNNGRLYFNTSQALVPQDVNGSQQDVYQYEPSGIEGPGGSKLCDEESETYAESALGCISLISSGRDPKESVFEDASETGNDVFFDTAARLSLLDSPEPGYDMYDAAVCGQPGTASCVPSPPPPEEECNEAGGCRNGGSEVSGTGFGHAGTANNGTGGQSSVHVLDEKTEKPTTKPTTPKPLTRAQKYAKALAACKKIKNKHKHAQCVAAAKKKYGPLGKKSSKKPAKKAARR
jgi:hypothetical protein